jgi:hypothetical protein
MRKILTAGLAALTLGGSVAATAVPADAAGWHGGGGFHGGGGHWRGGGGWGWGVGAGLLGLAAGAAIADSYHPYYGGYYGGPGYYPGPGYYGYGYAGCVGRHRVWDPYVGGYVIRSFRYAC